MIEEIKKLAKEEGAYQDIEVNGSVISKGWRDCEERWEIIKPYIDKNSVVLDIGSHYGYFAKKMADTYEDNLIWSIEGDKRRAEIQRLMIEANGIKNIVLSEYNIGILDFLKLSRLTEGIDTIMMLSVIHYFDPEEIPYIIWLCSQIAPRLIIEIPVVEEVEVAEIENVDKLKNIENYLNSCYENIIEIGKSTSPKNNNVKRTIFRAENKSLSKKGLIGFIGGEIGRTHSLNYKNSKWTLDSRKKFKTGLNLYNLMMFNVISPNVDKLKLRVAQRYFDVLKTKCVPTDISYRNSILTPFDVEVIDFKEGNGTNIYGNTWEYYKDTMTKYSIDDFLDLLEKRF